MNLVQRLIIQTSEQNHIRIYTADIEKLPAFISPTFATHALICRISAASLF
jgi:hypothetical protein